MSTRPLLPVNAEHVAEENIPEDSVGELREELDELREEFLRFRVGVDADRKKLGMFLTVLQNLFNGGPTPATSPLHANAPGQPIPASAYDAWKERLPPSCGRVIDALLAQPMNYVQIKNFCKMGASTLDQALAKLRANQLIEKDGTLNRLKRL